MSERLEAKVAQILTERDLVLNRGSDDGVTVGMRFAILNRRGADIRDPDTGESLGSVELPKTFVKVVSTKERLAIARTFREFRSKAGPLFSLSDPITQLSAPPRVRTETLKTTEPLVQLELDEAESYVKVGDPAVEMIGEEYSGAGDL